MTAEDLRDPMKVRLAIKYVKNNPDKSKEDCYVEGMRRMKVLFIDYMQRNFTDPVKYKIPDLERHVRYWRDRWLETPQGD